MLYKLQDIPTAVVTHHPENNFSAIGLVGQTLAQPTDLGSVTAATLSSGASSGPGGAIDPPTGSEQLYVALARPGDGFIPVEHDYAMHDWRHMIPGMSLLPSSQQWLGDGSGSASCGNSGASSNDSGTALDLFSTASLLSPNSAITPTPSFPSLPVVPLIDDYAPIVPASSQLPSSPTHSWPFRPSVWELEPELVATGSRTSPVTTSIFRK